MSDCLLALTTAATFAEIFVPTPPGLPLVHAPSAGDALARLESDPGCRLVLVEREIEPQLGRLVQRLRRSRPGLEVLLLSAPVSEAVRGELQAQHIDVLERGATRPDFLYELRRRYERAALQARAGLVGFSPRLREVVETILQIGPTDVPVLVTGPSGSGKELVARALWGASRRAERPFVALNVGALAESVLESELFGHEKGAFTGAVARKAGVFERADGGTLFLDEVGEMSAHMQVRLLRAVDSGEITPVGGTRSQHVDARLLAATHRRLDEAVRRGEFRQDLYYRLKVVQIEMPGLAARRADLPVLVQHFLAESARLYGTRAQRLSEPALRLLEAYDWPGNVRELRNVVHSMAVLAKSPTIEESEVPGELWHASAPNLPVLANRSHEQAERDVILQSLLALRHDLREVLEILRGGDGPRRTLLVEAPRPPEEPPHSLRQGERELIRSALAAMGGNRRQAAERLGIAERSLYRKLKEYGLS